jgi:hypothetical protein
VRANQRAHGAAAIEEIPRVLRTGRFAVLLHANLRWLRLRQRISIQSIPILQRRDPVRPIELLSAAFVQ